MIPPSRYPDSVFRREVAASYCADNRCDLFHLVAHVVGEATPAREICRTIVGAGRCSLMRGSELFRRGR